MHTIGGVAISLLLPDLGIVFVPRIIIKPAWASGKLTEKALSPYDFVSLLIGVNVQERYG